jgi:DNA (cytosine-5)-methyltransferase 1
MDGERKGYGGVELNELALFAGAGGGILGGKLLGWRTVCAVEVNAYCCRRLMQRQNEGHLPPFPIWDDVCTFDGRPWRGVVDVVSGGFPCQDISAAGKGDGIEGARSGLWTEMARIIGEVRPRFAFVENSPILTSRGLGTVLGDLASLGFDAEWGVLGAADVGAPHQRDRIWVVAHAERAERGQERGACRGLARADGISQREESTGWAGSGGKDVADAASPRCSTGEPCEGGQIRDETRWAQPERRGGEVADTNGMRELQPQRGERKKRGWASDGGWWGAEPALGRVAHGVAHRVDRLRAIGNGQVPQCAAEAFRRLLDRIKH